MAYYSTPPHLHHCFWPSMVAIFFAFTIIIIKLLRSYFIEKSKKPKLPPGPKPWPIVGLLPEMLLLTNKQQPVYKWIHNFMRQMNTEIACFRLGNVHVIPVTCPTLAREFLRKQDLVFASRPRTMATEMASKGYLTTALVPYGEQWTKMKKILINDLLSPKKHKWLQHKRDNEADNLVFYVYHKCKYHSGLVNVRTAARRYSGNVTRKLIFGTRYWGQGGGHGVEETEHVDAIFALLKYVYAFCVSDYIPCLRGLDLDGHERKVKEAMRIMNKYHDPIIQERIKQWNDGSKTEQHDWLDVLISLKNTNNQTLLTSEEIKAQVIELMAAAVDNPSNTVEWALAEMINQPRLLQRATEELEDVVGKERLVQESDIPKLRFVKACAREAFRLHPIVPFNVPHVSMEDTIVGNCFIPKDSHVLLSRPGLGRNPKVWDEPLKFKPERHLVSDDCDVVLTEPDLRFISFSTGRRGCPGVVLGTTMTVMLLARLLHAFTWATPPNVSSINLVESIDDMFLAEPLVAIAKPRLATYLYQEIE